jgi:hypothetical protein
MIIVHRSIRSCFHQIRRTLIAERIPQYKERSTLLPGGLNTPFSIVVEPDIDLELLFRSHEQLQENLQRRHWIVDVKKVEHDYQVWKKLNKQIADASSRRSRVDEYNSLRKYYFFKFSLKNYINGVINYMHLMQNFLLHVYVYLLHYMQLYLRQVNRNYYLNMVVKENQV